MDVEQEQEELYRQLVELAPDGIIVHDGERIVLVNAAAVRLLGATHRREVAGQSIDVFLDPPFLKAVQQQLMGPDDPVGEEPPPMRERLRRLDGSRIEVEVTTIAFMNRDRPSVHLVIRDISDRLAAEERMRVIEQRLHQAQRMEVVGALAGGVAHEINNSMSVVLGFSNFLLNDQHLPGSLQSDARHIVKAAHRAASVAAQLLSFSRRAVHEPQVVDLAIVVRDSEPVIRRLLGETRHLALATGDSVRVRIDPRQLDQVIVNLALNARDAMPSDGTLSITTKEVELGPGAVMAGGAAVPAGRYGVLVMSDDGVGMDRATQTRIFEPFFTTKPVGQGSGLGLAASYGVVKQNDGYIAVVSTPGHGAAFSVYLPIVTEDVAGERRQFPRLPREDSRALGATVLLVEDDPSVRALAARILSLGGFQILEASDGTRALELVTQHGRPDLVVSDVAMPSMGGPELARRLRARWPTLPILFMSGYSAEELHERGVLGSESITIPKPFTPNGLVESVTEALSYVLSKGATQS